MALGQQGRVLAWLLLLLLCSPSAAALADDTLIGWQGEQYREPGADLRRVRLFPAAQPIRRIARVLSTRTSGGLYDEDAWTRQLDLLRACGGGRLRAARAHVADDPVCMRVQCAP
jgi:hypothetical protein